MKISFKRITSSGRFIPEIDGLRFIAISSVVIFHLSGFIIEKDQNIYLNPADFTIFKQLFSKGHLGVPLFFIISGFILGLPFANYYLQEGNPINIRRYFSRRLTRLEPPYILVMTVLLFGSIYVANTLSMGEGIKSYLSSILYSHNFIYPNTLPKLNSVAWSLEVEVQFYVLAPLMAFIFKIRNMQIRRLIIIIVTILFVFVNNYNFNPLGFLSLINYFQYFLLGFLLADLYVTKSIIFIKTKFDFYIGLILFTAIWLYDKDNLSFNSHKFIWELTQITLIFFFYYYVLFHKIFRLLSNSIITNIGGMCYSIYLLHYPIISLFGNYILKLNFSNYAVINIILYVIIIMFFLISISSIFFILIERPFMRNDWYKKILKNT